MTGVQIFWLTPLLPLAVFVLLALGLTRFRKLATVLAIGAMTGATLTSLSGLLMAIHGEEMTLVLPWLTVGGRAFMLALWLDPLSTLVASLVSVIGLLVFIYAASYMKTDPWRGRFFTEMSLFTGSMLMLVQAADLMTLFIFWELVGLCSYLLIGFWFERSDAPPAASKAFFVTRLADLLLFLGILLLISQRGTGSIQAMLTATTQGKVDRHLLTVVTLLLFAGAAGKSAQLPFQGWLPDAMAGPTPVSALLHSATMVAAGVFLVARLYPLFLAIPTTLSLMAWIGVLTSLLGGLAALVEIDLKRALAYSTMSQIGLMFVGLGSGSLLAGILLFVAQAFYKATLFLSAGIIDHTVKGTSLARMGGLLQRMPYTAAAFAVSTAALAGLPVTLALPPKDPVLAAALFANRPLFVVALFASLLTALYSARLFGVVFLGQPTDAAKRAQEGSRGLLVPLLITAGLLVLVLLADSPLLGAPLSHFLGVSTPDTPLVTLLSLAIALLGVVLSLWERARFPQDAIVPWLRPMVPLFTGEFGLQILYRFLTVFWFRCVELLGAFDCLVFDALTNACVRLLLGLVHLSGTVDLQGINAFFNDLGQGILSVSQRLRKLQTGSIENYFLVVFLWGLGVVALAVLAIFIR